MSQELVNGASSYTVQSSTFTMTMAEGKTFATADMEADMLVCWPYTLAEADTKYFCQGVELYTPKPKTSDSNTSEAEGIWYNNWYEVTTIPKFGDTDSLYDQMKAAAGTEACSI